MTLRSRRKRQITALITTARTRLNSWVAGSVLAGSALLATSALTTSMASGQQASSNKHAPPPVSSRPVANHAERARLRFEQQFQRKSGDRRVNPVDQRAGSQSKPEGKPEHSVLKRLSPNQNIKQASVPSETQRQPVQVIRETINTLPTVKRTSYSQPNLLRQQPANLDESSKQDDLSKIPPAPLKGQPQDWQVPDVDQPATLTPPTRVADNPYPVVQPNGSMQSNSSSLPGTTRSLGDQDLPSPAETYGQIPNRVDDKPKQEPSSVMVDPRDDRGGVAPVRDPFSDQAPNFRPSRVRQQTQDKFNRIQPRLQNPQNQNRTRPNQIPVGDLRGRFADPAYQDMSCDEFREQMMKQTIRDIDLNISPYGPQLRAVEKGASRSWSDRYGNVLATGSMTKLRHGYVYVDTGSGAVRLPIARLSDDDLAEVAAVWYLPTACSLGNYRYAERKWMPQTFTWKASALCHKPLYYEDVQLERYGHSAGPLRQPIRSTVHFFGSLVFTPYQTAYQHPTDCQYALGYYRPGNCAPWLVDPIPVSLSGAVRQAVWTVGGAYLFFP